MGQNSSTHVQARPHSGGNNTEPKAPPPVTPPPAPKIPNYAVPENLVLPANVVNKRPLLKPVSQKLSRFHPEYAEIFQYNDDGSLLKTKGAGSESPDKENTFQGDSALVNGDKDSLDNKGRIKAAPHHLRASSEFFEKPNVELSRSNSVQARHPNSLPNGVTSRANGHISVEQTAQADTKDSKQVAGVNGFGIHRTNSVLNRTNPAPKGSAHRRLHSASVGLASQDAAITEDPREQQDLPGPAGPGVTSLPAKHSFDLDYSFNLTYAQLAEFRRQSRQAELDSRAGGTGPEDETGWTGPSTPSGKTGEQFSVASASNSRSDFGKTKKRRAPPPPGERRDSSQGERRDSSPGSQSLAIEPPADYELDDLPPIPGVSTPRKFSIQSQISSSSSSSRGSKGPAPKIPALVPPSFSPPPPPTHSPLAVSPASSISLSASKASPRASSRPKVGGGVARSNQPSERPDVMIVSTAKAIAEARAELEALEKLKASWRLEEEEKEEDDEEGEKKKEQQEEKIANNSLNKDGIEQDETHATYVTDNTEAKLNSPGDPTEVGPDLAHSLNREQKGQSAEGTMPSVSSVDEGKAEVKGELSEAGDEAPSPRKLSSLLQHDIVLAAQARSAKSLVKTPMSSGCPKPKGQHELFRDELQKAALAREQRRMSKILSRKHEKGQSTGNVIVVWTSDASKQQHSPDARNVTVVNVSNALNAEDESACSKQVKESRTDKSEAYVLNFCTAQVPSGVPSTGPDKQSHEAVQKEPVAASPQPMLSKESEPVRTAMPVVMNGVMDLSDEEVACVSSVEEKRYSTPFASAIGTVGDVASPNFSRDWKPEDDLDSDDDINSDTTYSRSSAVLEASGGFKSSMVPSRMDDLKMARRSTKSTKVRGAESSDEQDKHGSSSKFRRSVHENVRNVFDSISSAPGKILKRNKSHDLGLGPREVNSTHPESPSSSIGKNLEVVGTRPLSFLEDADNEGGEVSLDYSNNVRMMKRAGVAYVGSKGQIVVLPEYEPGRLDQTGHVRKDDEWHVPKIFNKKKKFTYESTVRKKEKERVAEEMADEIRQRERQMEIERLRQTDTEMQFRRLRQAELQERLQSENVQQQQLDPISASALLVQRAPSSILPHHQQQQQQQHFHASQTSAEETAVNSGSTLGPFPNAATPAGVHLPANTSSISPPQHSLYRGQTSVAGGFLAGHGPLASTTGVSMPISMPSYTVNASGVLTPPSSAGGYDVSYLNAHPTSLGLHPPAAQPQWAYLLGSVASVDIASQAAAPGLYGNSKGLGVFLPAALDSTALGTMTSFTASGGQPISGPALAGSSQMPVAMVNPMPGVLMDMPAAVNGFSASLLDMPGSGGEAGFLVLGPEASRYYRDLDNPVYVSSDEEEDFSEQDGQDDSLAAMFVSGGHQVRQPPHRTVLPPVRQSGAYHNVTSAEEAGVTRVRVPDYTHGDLSSAQQGAHSDLGNSSKPDVVTWRGPVPFVHNDHKDNDYNSALKASTLTPAAGKQLPPKVYGPLGYRPVTFSRPGT